MFGCMPSQDWVQLALPLACRPPQNDQAECDTSHRQKSANVYNKHSKSCSFRVHSDPEDPDFSNRPNQ